LDVECEFCQIVRGERSARVVANAPDALAFFPLRPVCAGHTIVIPKPESTGQLGVFRGVST
jgi:histidine triad (HIT) family protein